MCIRDSYLSNLRLNIIYAYSSNHLEETIIFYFQCVCTLADEGHEAFRFKKLNARNRKRNVYSVSSRSLMGINSIQTTGKTWNHTAGSTGGDGENVPERLYDTVYTIDQKNLVPRYEMNSRKEKKRLSNLLSSSACSYKSARKYAV